MKNIIKVNAILTNVILMNNKMSNYSGMEKYGLVKPPKWDYFTYHIGDKKVTSDNPLSVSAESQDGHHMTVWIVENKPKRVYRHKIGAMIFG